MIDINFSIYGDQPTVLEDPAFLLEDFKRQHNISVNLDRLPFEEAWPKLVNFALHGGGPHLSQIGSIWTSTLMLMNVLRPFSAAEIADMGGVDSFFPSTWQNSILSDKLSAWGIPLSAYVYFVVYRRDLLHSAGVDEKTAFESAEAMLETVKKVSAAKIKSPLLLPSIQPFVARTHIIASWIWGAQGDFMSADGQDVLLSEPAALSGLGAFYKLYRYMSPADTNLTYDDCIQHFAAGEAAVIVGGIASQSVISQCNVRGVVDNLGIASLPGVPWIGGSNLVIWNETRMFPIQEKAALTLVRFLADVNAQIGYATDQKVIPARIEALAGMEFETPQFKEVCEKSLRTGRSYHAGPGWMRMLSELRRRFDAITTEVLSDRESDVDRILEKHLVPVAERFKLLISH